MISSFSFPYASALKRKQRLLLGTLVAGLTIVMVSVLVVLLREDTSPLEKSSEKKTEITSGSKRIKPQEVWVQRLESQTELSLKRIEALEKMLEQLLNLNSQKPLEAKGDEGLKTKNQEGGDIGELRQHLASALQSSAHEEKKGRNEAALPPSPQNDISMNPAPSDPNLKLINYGSAGGNLHTTENPSFHQWGAIQPVKVSGLQKISLKLNNIKSNSIKKTQDNTIPAGAFAKAVLLGGVDASTSISSSSDPRPVLLRVMDTGTLPRKFKSDLKDCHVLASSYGDISSERVFMRLEKLTCTERKTGEISETIVSGYVAGEDGRAGVRGVLADRAGEMMRNSLVGGFFSGMAKFITQAQNPMTFTPVAPFGQTNPLSHEQMLKAGAGQGTGSALERYADFYIKRAEQMQPVLQVAAGREVNIVFTEGTAFGETSYKNAYSKVRDRKRQETVRDLSHSNTSSEEVAHSNMQDWIPSQHEMKN
ncbi:MAG: TraB/VirB10 family protein [Alphaproteobacteria bacterium]|nr:TraB/VirB10 family protein [Alphaproteobacteria bacterium]